MRPKSKYIVETADGYAIDRLVQRDGIRLHVYKSGFRTIADAKFAMKETIDEAFDRMRSERFDEKTLGQAFRVYMMDISSKKAEQTVYGIKTKLMKHFLPSFNMNRAAKKELTPERISSWYARFVTTESLNQDSKNKLLGNVRDFLAYCWKKTKVITSDSYADIMGILDPVTRDKAPRKEKVIWTDEELSSFIGVHPRGSMEWVMFTFFFYLGARKAEFLALTWDSIDWGKQTVKIDKQMIKSGGVKITHNLKTRASYRECYLSDEMAGILREYKEREGNPESSYIFHSRRNADGSAPMSFNDFREYWENAERKANVPHATPHSARHRKATELAMLCENQEDVRTSADFLGRSPSMMLDVYAHANAQSIKKLMERKSACTPK